MQLIQVCMRGRVWWMKAKSNEKKCCSIECFLLIEIYIEKLYVRNMVTFNNLFIDWSQNKLKQISMNRFKWFSLILCKLYIYLKMLVNVYIFINFAQNKIASKQMKKFYFEKNIASFSSTHRAHRRKLSLQQEIWGN